MDFVLVGAAILVGVNTLLGLIAFVIRRSVKATRRAPGGGGVSISRPELIIKSNGGIAAVPAKVEVQRMQAVDLPVVVAPPQKVEVEVDSTASAASQGAQISAAQSQTDFGRAAPLAQNMSTYVFGDDLYDESFEIAEESGNLLAEMGMGIAEAADWDDGKNVLAFEIWMFDVHSGQTKARLLLTETGYETSAIRKRFEKQGEVIKAAPGTWITLETENIVVRARLVDVVIRENTRVEGIIFERVTVEFAGWDRTGLVPQIPSPQPLKLDEPPAPEPASTPQPVTSENIPRPQTGPQVFQQNVQAGYSVSYAKNVYLGTPFQVVIEYGGRSPGGRRSRGSGGTDGIDTPGEVVFTHQTYQGGRSELPDFEPRIQVNVIGNKHEFQIPVRERTTKLISGGGMRLEFDVRPVDIGSLLLLIETVYLGEQFVPERELGTTISRNPVTGEIEAIMTRHAPGDYYPAPEVVARETLKVNVRSFLGLPPAAISAFTWLFGLANLVIYCFLTVFTGQALDGLNPFIIGVSAFASTVPLVLASMLARR